MCLPLAWYTLPRLYRARPSLSCNQKNETYTPASYSLHNAVFCPIMEGKGEYLQSGSTIKHKWQNRTYLIFKFSWDFQVSFTTYHGFIKLPHHFKCVAKVTTWLGFSQLISHCSTTETHNIHIQHKARRETDFCLWQTVIKQPQKRILSWKCIIINCQLHHGPPTLLYYSPTKYTFNVLKTTNYFQKSFQNVIILHTIKKRGKPK
jgi:hypothetical protein